MSHVRLSLVAQQMVEEGDGEHRTGVLVHVGRAPHVSSAPSAKKGVSDRFAACTTSKGEYRSARKVNLFLNIRRAEPVILALPFAVYFVHDSYERNPQTLRRVTAMGSNNDILGFRYMPAQELDHVPLLHKMVQMHSKPEQFQSAPNCSCNIECGRIAPNDYGVKHLHGGSPNPSDISPSLWRIGGI
jgi:hypothetical protein